MRQSGKPTRYPGIYRIDDKTFRARGKLIDPRTGKTKEFDRVLRGVTARDAADQRAAMLKEAQGPEANGQRVRVGEFAKSWMRSKRLKLDPTTAATYADALDDHILPVFGELFYDAITPLDVQRWIDDSLVAGWKTSKRSGDGDDDTDDDEDDDDEPPRSYSSRTVHGWFRVFRTMTRDAIAMLGLARDPTLRISFPDAKERDEANALSPEQLATFLTVMREKYATHYALVVLLAYTGLRFCHASALHWEDWDEENGVLRVRRKQVRGKLGEVTRKKRAPKEYPVEPELAEVLRWHRRQLIADQAPGLEKGYMFPSTVGTLRAPSSLEKAWKKSLVAAKIDKRFTIHGLRYTFTDLTRRANVDPVVRRALTGHVTEEMQRKYSTVGLDEKRAAVAGVLKLVRVNKVGTEVGTVDQTERVPEEMMN
jgi:integrase